MILNCFGGDVEPAGNFIMAQQLLVIGHIAHKQLMNWLSGNNLYLMNN